jgi:hypothetical protein
MVLTESTISGLRSSIPMSGRQEAMRHRVFGRIVIANRQMNDTLPVRDIAEIKTLSKPTRLEQQQIVLKLFGYRLCDAAAKAELEQKAQRVARLSTLPIFIPRDISQYLTHQRVF